MSVPTSTPRYQSEGRYRAVKVVASRRWQLVTLTPTVLYTSHVQVSDKHSASITCLQHNYQRLHKTHDPHKLKTTVGTGVSNGTSVVAFYIQEQQHNGIIFSHLHYYIYFFNCFLFVLVCLFFWKSTTTYRYYFKLKSIINAHLTGVMYCVVEFRHVVYVL